MPFLGLLRVYRPARFLTVVAVLLCGFSAGTTGVAHERGETLRPLTDDSAGRALEAAEWLVDRARRTPRAATDPLPADAPAADLARWLPAAADLGDRAKLEAFRERLGALGYETGDHDPLVLWQDDIYRTLAAYDALISDAAEDDPARLWEALNALPAESDDAEVQAEIARLRRRIDLATVPGEDLAAVRPHMDRIARLLSIAREWNE